VGGFQWQRVPQGLSRPMPYPINTPQPQTTNSPTSRSCGQCILCCGLSRPANANPAETANYERADITTASSDFLPGFHAWLPATATSSRFPRGFCPDDLLASNSCLMRLTSFPGWVGFISEGWRRQSSMAAPQAWRCQTTKLWLSVQQYYVRVDVC